MKQHYYYNEDESLFTPPFSGWVNMFGSSAFKSKYKQNELLTISNNPKSLVNNSQFYTDWVVEEEKVFPYQLDDILIQPNELVTAHVLNATFEKLYTNLEYLVSRSIFYSNNIPDEYIGWFGCALNMVDGYYNDVNSKPTSGDTTYEVDSVYKFHSYTKPCYQYYPCRYASMVNIKTDIDIYTYPLLTIIDTDGYKLLAKEEDPYYNDINTASTYSNPSNAFYDNLKDVINFSTKSSKQVSLMISSSAILMKQFNSSETNGFDIKDLYDNGSILSSINGHKFENINSADLNANGLLYLSDNNTKNIYQFDLSFIINDDAVIKTPRLINIIGGTDSNVDKIYKFSDIKFIKSSGDNLFVYDGVEHNIKVFDKYLNFRKLISNVGFTFNVPVGVVYRELQDEFIILCENAKYFVFDSQFNLKHTHQLTDISEKCIAFASSTIDSNVYYIATESSMIQKLFSNNATIGYFKFADLNIKNDTLKWWRSTHIAWVDCEDLWGGSYNFPSFMNTFNIVNISVRNVNNSDEIWVFANNGRLVWLKNNVEMISLFDDTDNVNKYELLYKKENLKCSEQEYVQSFTYNKLSRKFVDILHVIIDNLKYKPIYEYNSSGEMIYLRSDEITEELSKIITDNHLKNIKIYDNDILSVDVINRMIKNLFDIEQKILNATKAEVLNSKYQKTQNMEISIKE